jgi:hypothetical protein
VFLVFANCCKYNNPGDDVVIMAKKMKSRFRKMMKQTLKTNSVVTIDDDKKDDVTVARASPREELEEHLVQLRQAGIEESETMSVVDCPGCGVEQVVGGSLSPPSCSSCGVSRPSREQSVDIGFIKVNMKPTRSFDDRSELQQEFRIAEGQFLRMQARCRRHLKIVSIDIVYNGRIRNRFEAKKFDLRQRGLNDAALMVFHGTRQKNIDSILRDNFSLDKMTNGRTFGDGVYFSECPEVSLGYSRDQQSLVLCKVLQDGVREVRNVKSNKFRAKDIGSESERCWAIIVPDVDLILPCYVINFTEGTEAQSDTISRGNASSSSVLHRKIVQTTSSIPSTS